MLEQNFNYSFRVIHQIIRIKFEFFEFRIFPY